jgi:predicted SnoaL-like aldol condensation-catalyzing enzyme
MSTEENKAVVRRELEELYNEGGNLDAAEEVYAPDFVGHEPAVGDIRGVEGAKQYAATMAEGDKVVTRWSAHGTHQGETEDLGPATGNRMEITGISIERFYDGKVAESWDNYDALGMMQQLGLVPAPEQAQA